MKVSNEFRVGLLSLLIIAAFVWGYNFLKGTNIFTPNKTYYSVYDNIQGLQAGRAININGLKIGTIAKISFLDDKLDKILVQMELQKEINIPRNSSAVIKSSGLMGDKEIQINLGDEQTYFESGDTIAGKIDEGVLESLTQSIDPIKALIVKNLVSLQEVLSGFEKVLNNSNIASLESSMRNINTLTANTVDITANVNEIVIDNKAHINTILRNFDVVSKDLASVSGKINKEELGDIIVKLNQSLSSLSDVLAKVQRGEGTLGRLTEDEQLYNNLTDATKSLDVLLKDLKANPKRYINVSVFGGGNREKKEKQ